jgi:glutaconate CoA-transferase subunit A
MEIIESGQKELLQPPDVEEFRRWMRENKSPALRDKVMDEREAVKRFVKDGDYIGVELYGTVRCPMSVIREIVRQGKKKPQTRRTRAARDRLSRGGRPRGSDGYYVRGL